MNVSVPMHPCCDKTLTKKESVTSGAFDEFIILVGFEVESILLLILYQVMDAKGSELSKVTIASRLIWLLIIYQAPHMNGLGQVDSVLLAIPLSFQTHKYKIPGNTLYQATYLALVIFWQIHW